MLNFGVQEIANSRPTNAPGWAYVPHNGVTAPVSGTQPTSGRRARNVLTASAQATTAKQDAKILRELAALDRENHRDVLIPVPVKHRDNAGRVHHGKVTPTVRKILQSQKTFANHLSDFEALFALNASSTSQPTPSSHPATPAARTTPMQVANTASRSRRKDSITPASHSKRPAKRKDGKEATNTRIRKGSACASQTAGIKLEPNGDVTMSDAPSSFNLLPGSSDPPPPHPGDNDPLLVSKIPSVPTDTELHALLAAPPLTYNESRGFWSKDDRRKPVRVFCGVCGYWGRVRCTRCAERVCALECLKTHQEDCFTRYGA